jgi:hypothetical protein
MQHLDDALIAEWVDGAVPPESQQHAAIAAHVERCDECRARVDEERALAGHVRQLLGVAAPPERVPPFEQVLHRAGTTARPAPSSGFPWRRLAWAATLVVAGGVGWYARGLVIPSGSDGTAAPAQMASRAATAPVETVPADSVAGHATAAAAPTAVGGVARREEAAAPGRSTQTPPPREAVADRVIAAEAQAADERVAARRDAAPPPAPAAVEPRPFGQVRERFENELRMQKVAADFWVTTTRTDAERILGHPLLTLPDRPVVGIELAADSGAVRVRQSLDERTILELVQSRQADVPTLAAEGVAARAAAPREGFARNASPTVEAVVDGLRIVASAPLSADSLRVLLVKLRR